MKVEILPLGILNSYSFVIVFSVYDGKVLLSRKRGKCSWELQGGHIENGETPINAAKRELFEESGVLDINMVPLFDYRTYEVDSHNSEKNIKEPDLGKPGRNGIVFFANVLCLGVLPKSEIEEICLWDYLPDNLTYPEITSLLYQQLITEGKLYKLINNIDE